MCFFLGYTYMKPIEIIKEVRNHTKDIILFHSLAGKDSIVLLDMCSNIFDTVHCVYMPIVPNLEHMNRYKRFFLSQYSNIKFYEYEHFAINSYKKLGHLGIKKDTEIKNNSLAKIMIQVQKDIGLQWIILGSKQSDGLSRRLQLKTYEYEAINYKNTKAYPLSKWKNSNVLNFIEENNLIAPLNYGDNRKSQSNDVIDPIFLSWCKKNFPGDYQKIITMFPECEIILFRYENKTK